MSDEMKHMVMDDRIEALYKDAPPVEISPELQAKLDAAFEEFLKKEQAHRAAVSQ